MKKIMFNDRYGLTAAVLAGRKTMTRRIIPHQPEGNDWEIRFYNFSDHRYEDDPMKDPYFGSVAWQAPDGRNTGLNKLRWLPGEEVAIAQPYMKIPEVAFQADLEICKHYRAGWKNKMFVSSDLMPRHVKITNVKLERLQDITDEDCLREGIDKAYLGYYVNGLRTRDWEKESHVEKDGKTYKLFPSPQDAFAALIDKVSGKGTWEKNPWVFAYSFELID